MLHLIYAGLHAAGIGAQPNTGASSSLRFVFLLALVEILPLSARSSAVKSACFEDHRQFDTLNISFIYYDIL